MLATEAKAIAMKNRKEIQILKLNTKGLTPLSNQIDEGITNCSNHGFTRLDIKVFGVSESMLNHLRIYYRIQGYKIKETGKGKSQKIILFWT